MKARPLIMAATLGLVMVPFAIRLAHKWNPEFVFYSVVLLIEAAAVIWMDARVRFSWWVLAALGVWAVLHMAGGTLPIPESITEPGRPATLYNLRIHPALPKYDQVVHAFGFGAATLAAWEAINVMSKGMIRPGAGLIAMLTLVGSGLGALNEVIEFVATRLMPDTNVGGYDNTGWDLVSNLVGSAAAAGIACFSARRLPGANLPASPAPCTTSAPSCP